MLDINWFLLILGLLIALALLIWLPRLLITWLLMNLSRLLIALTLLIWLLGLLIAWLLIAWLLIDLLGLLIRLFRLLIALLRLIGLFGATLCLPRQRAILLRHCLLWH